MKSISGIGIGLVVFSASLLARPWPQAQVRDNTATPGRPAGSGSLAGAVLTDDGSGQPVRRAMVTVTPVEGGAPKIVFANDAGRFTVPGLAPGRYFVVATKASYVKMAYGAKRSDRSGTPVNVVAGQDVSSLVVHMARGAVLSGRVVDEHGMPATEVIVRASMVRTGVGGERTFAGPVGGATSSVTDDRGTYRIYGLQAGEYVISVMPAMQTSGDIRETTPADVQSVTRAIQAASTPGGSPAAPPPPPPVTVAYATVYYPATTDASSATPVTLGSGEERDGIDLALQLVHTAHVGGTVVTPQGLSPQRVQLLLVPEIAAGLPVAIGLNRAPITPDGHFTYAGIAPGRYTITARASAGGGSGAGANAAAAPKAFTFGAGNIDFGPATSGGQVYWGQADVTVNGEDVSNLEIALQPGLTMSGHIAVESPGAATPDFSRARISLSPAATAGGGLMLGVPAATIDPNGKFTMPDITPGRYRVTATLAAPGDPWKAKSIVFKGRDVLDFPLEVAAGDDLSNVAVTFTSQTQEISGRLQDASGRPAPDYTIVVFPADQALWGSPRRVRTTRPDTDGHFSIADLPPGDYHIAAVVDIAPNETSDPSFLTEINGASIAIALHEGEKKVQDLKIG